MAAGPPDLPVEELFEGQDLVDFDLSYLRMARIHGGDSPVDFLAVRLAVVADFELQELLRLDRDLRRQRTLRLRSGAEEVSTQNLDSRQNFSDRICH